MRMSARGHDDAHNMQSRYASLSREVKGMDVNTNCMANKYDNLVEEINKQEEAKEEKNSLDEELRLLKQAVSNLQDCVSKVEQADKDGTDMMKALNAATDSMDMAVYAFCRAVARAESTVLKVEMTDECKNEIKSAREKLIEAEITLLANHRKCYATTYPKPG